MTRATGHQSCTFLHVPSNSANMRLACSFSLPSSPSPPLSLLPSLSFPFLSLLPPLLSSLLFPPPQWIRVGYRVTRNFQCHSCWDSTWEMHILASGLSLRPSTSSEPACSLAPSFCDQGAEVRKTMHWVWSQWAIRLELGMNGVNGPKEYHIPLLIYPPVELL